MAATWSGGQVSYPDFKIDKEERLTRGPCHGADLSGEVVIDDPAIGAVYAPNITGLGESRSDDEPVLAIRHGLAPDGRQLIIMPAESFNNFSAEDLGAVIAYLKSVPAIENDLPEPALSFLGRILLAAGMFGQIVPADYIDHDQPFATMPVIGPMKSMGGTWLDYAPPVMERTSLGVIQRNQTLHLLRT